MFGTTITLLLILLNFVALQTLWRKRRRREGEPPLVNHRIPFVGSALAFGKDPLNYLRRLQEQNGDVFTIELAGWNTHVFMNPLDVRSLEQTKMLGHKEILGDFVTRMVGSSNHSMYNSFDNNRSSFAKCAIAIYRRIKNALCQSTHFEEEPEVKKECKAPSASDDCESKTPTQSIETNLRGSVALSDLCDTARHAAVVALQRSIKFLKASELNSTVKLYTFSQRVVFDITFNLFFGSHCDPDMREEETERFYKVFKKYFKRSALLVDRVPIHFLPETKRALKQLLKMISEIDWSERKNVSQLVTDVIESSPEPDQRSRHLLVLLWSAQANTAPGLFWTLYHLMANPDAKRAVLLEYEEMLRHRVHSKCRATTSFVPANDWPDMNDILNVTRSELDKLVILDGCLKETMRLTGSSMNIRKAVNDTILKTESGARFSIRKGDYTLFFAPVTHMDSDIFQNAEEYVHDRFIASRRKSTRSVSDSCDSDCVSTSDDRICSGLVARKNFYKSGKRIPSSRALMTFGFGISRCPGRHIAMIEIKLVVLSLFKHLDVRFSNENVAVPGFDLTHLGFGIMPPVTDVTISLKDGNRSYLKTT